MLRSVIAAAFVVGASFAVMSTAVAQELVPCAPENGFCDFRGTKRVRYGAGGRFVERVSRGGIPCNNRVFGDPAPGIPKVCQVLD